MSLYELSSEAEKDPEKVTEYTYENHGATQTRKYIDQLDECATNLATGHGHYK